MRDDTENVPKHPSAVKVNEWAGRALEDQGRDGGGGRLNRPRLLPAGFMVLTHLAWKATHERGATVAAVSYDSRPDIVHLWRRCPDCGHEGAHHSYTDRAGEASESGADDVHATTAIVNDPDRMRHLVGIQTAAWEAAQMHDDESAGAELSRLEEDVLEIRDALADALGDESITINRDGILDAIKRLALSRAALDAVDIAQLGLALNVAIDHGTVSPSDADHLQTKITALSRNEVSS